MVSKKPTQRSPVARHAKQFNKAVVFRDKTKYVRTKKHKVKEPYSMILPSDTVEYGFYPHTLTHAVVMFA